MATQQRILVTYGSRRGGTAEIARAIADELVAYGHTVDCVPASPKLSPASYDAVIVGGALYMMRWHADARRFVVRNAAALRARPVWMFSSGPLDASAQEKTIAPTRQVASLMERAGARGHATFGGRLAADAKGFLAAAMAKKMAGDWRDWDGIRAWTGTVAGELETAPRTAGTPAAPPARWILATLCLVVGIAALAGGLGLVLRPDGGLLHMPTSFLEHTPFASYLIPGLLLFAVIGLTNTIAGTLVLRHGLNGDVVAFVGGVALVIWIAAQMVLLRTTNGLQLVCLALGTAIAIEALRRIGREGKPAVTLQGRPS